MSLLDEVYGDDLQDIQKSINKSIRNEIRGRRQALIDAYNQTLENTPYDTIDVLANDIGFDDAVFAIAEAINSLNGDGRISDKNYDWAISLRGAANHNELENLGLYSLTGEIHPAHLNQLADEMRHICEKGW